MQFTLTLVNTAEGLPSGLENAAVAFLRAAGATLHDTALCGPALDLHFSGSAESVEPGQLSAQAAGWRVDYALQPTATRTKKLLISDMEMTLVQNEFLDDIAELAGIGEQVKAITACAMNGEIDFAGSLRARLALLKDQPADLLERAWSGMKLMPGARELFATFKAHGHRAIIVSGGFTIFTSRVREILGADSDVANTIEIREGRLTGHPVDPILGRETKQQVLEQTAAEMGIPLAETLAVGDGANDLPMLLRAGLGVAYHAKPSVAAAAKCRVHYSDLTALLAFAGLPLKG